MVKRYHVQPSERALAHPRLSNQPPGTDQERSSVAKGIGNEVHLGEQRIIHLRMRKSYKKRMRMPSMLDPLSPV
ncbi:hypothetical protein [Bradyrhizobium lablabi]|uniref:hypothetical protein n=1 Tax=Bradyrhizobium lablabi TaxID=722472 RepID=UPI000A8E94B5|nr:hypothetical protein [Bradyrhizobium lablabi]